MLYTRSPPAPLPPECSSLLLFRAQGSCTEWTEIAASDTRDRPAPQIENTCGRNCECVIKKNGVWVRLWKQKRADVFGSLFSYWIWCYFKLANAEFKRAAMLDHNFTFRHRRIFFSRYNLKLGVVCMTEYGWTTIVMHFWLWCNRLSLSRPAYFDVN